MERSIDVEQVRMDLVRCLSMNGQGGVPAGILLCYLYEVVIP